MARQSLGSSNWDDPLFMGGSNPSVPELHDGGGALMGGGGNGGGGIIEGDPTAPAGTWRPKEALPPMPSVTPDPVFPKQEGFFPAPGSLNNPAANADKNSMQAAEWAMKNPASSNPGPNPYSLHAPDTKELRDSEFDVYAHKGDVSRGITPNPALYDRNSDEFAKANPGYQNSDGSHAFDREGSPLAPQPQYLHPVRMGPNDANGNFKGVMTNGLDATSPEVTLSDEGIDPMTKKHVTLPVDQTGRAALGAALTQTQADEAATGGGLRGAANQNALYDAGDENDPGNRAYEAETANRAIKLSADREKPKLAKYQPQRGSQIR
jgi:hypothetical protein